MSHMARQSQEFGKDFGLVSEAVVTGRKVGAGKEFWSALAHNQKLFSQTVAFVMNGGKIATEVGSLEDQLASWVEAYAKVGISIDPATVVIPPHKAGFDRLLVVPQGMTAQQAFELCGQVMPTCKHDKDVSLDELDTASPRTATNGAYAVCCRDVVEADECHKNKSYDKLISKGMNFLTLTERLLFSLKYFLETGKQLDMNNITFTSSLRSRGGVFDVSYFEGRLGVNFTSRDDYDDFLCAREAILR